MAGVQQLLRDMLSVQSQLPRESSHGNGGVAASTRCFVRIRTWERGRQVREKLNTAMGRSKQRCPQRGDTHRDMTGHEPGASAARLGPFW